MTLRISWSTSATTTDDGVTTIDSTEHILEFDAVTKESHSSVSDVTVHTVENGQAISDHKRSNPRTIEIEAFVTNTPLEAPPRSGPRTSSTVSTTTESELGSVTTFSQEFDRVSDVWGVLLELQQTSVDLTVTTRYQSYENVQLVGLRVPRSTPEDAVSFELSLQEVFRATAETVDVVIPREPRESKKKNKTTGAESVKEAEEGGYLSRLSELFRG